MNEEIFDSISDLLAKSGTTVSKKLDGSIVVSLPDSSEKLADCTDNGDGTVSYTLYLGNGTEETGNGTPEEFKEHVLDALDSWIDYVPYDQFSVEPYVSAEYRRAIGESREDAMRRSLFEMGLDYDQAEAIMGVANALLESSLVTVNIHGHPVSGSSISNLVSRKENRNFLRRQWVLDKLGMTAKEAGTTPTAELIARAGVGEPTTDDLSSFVNKFLSSMTEERLHTDDEVLGTAWNQFDGAGKYKSTRTGSKTKVNTAVMDNEAPIESGETDEYDEEIEARGANLGNKTSEDGGKAFGSAEEASAEIGTSVTELKENELGAKSEAKTRIITMLAEKGYKYPGLVIMPVRELEKCLFAVEKLIEKNKFNAETDAEIDPGKLMSKAGYSKTRGPSEEDVAEEMMKMLWVGGINSLGSDETYSIPDEFIAQIKESASALKNSFDEYLEIIPKLPRGTATRYVMELLFGAPGNGVGGIVGGILHGDQAIMEKIAKGEKLIDGSSMTPAQYKGVMQALQNQVLGNAVRSVQDNLGNYIDMIVQGLPTAFDEACNNDVTDGSYAAIDPTFVTMIRSIMFGKDCPLSSYTWDAIDTLINDIGKVMTVSAPSGAQRKITGTVPGKTIKPKKPEEHS